MAYEIVVSYKVCKWRFAKCGNCMQCPLQSKGTANSHKVCWWSEGMSETELGMAETELTFTSICLVQFAL